MKKYTHLIIVALFFFWVIACTARDETITLTVASTSTKIPSDCPPTLPTAMPRPKFLKSIYPSNTITKEEYEKTLTNPILTGIHITVFANGIDDSVVKSTDVEYRRSTISNRIQLFVDEIFVSNDTSTVLDGLVDSGPFYFGWPVNLSIGFHKAKLIFNIDTGETVNYEWAFCVLP